MNTFIERHKYKILISRVFLIVLIILLLMTFSGCTVFSNIKSFFTERFSIEDDVKDITGVLNSFFDLVEDNNYQSAYEYLSSGDKSQGTLEDFEQDFANVTDIISININYVEVNNDTAVAGIDITDSYDGEEKIYKNMAVSLVREEGRSWKIVFWNPEVE